MKTRILLLINHLAYGGAARGVTLWAKMLADTNYNVTILTYYQYPYEYQLDSRITRSSLLSDIQDYLKLEKKIATCKQLLQSYLKRHPQDVIIPFLSNCNLLTTLASYNSSKVTQTILNSPWDKEQGLKLAFRDWAIQKQGSVILQNEEQAEYFNSPAFEHVKKYIVHNALNPDIIHIQKKNYHTIKKIIAVGRLVPQKNHSLMIETIRILRDKYHEKYHLDIYGVGDLQTDLQKQIDAAKLNNQVKLCGQNSDIFNILIGYDLFLMTSLHEGTPNALLEAMGIGLPALAVKCRTGITELIDNSKNGYIVDSYAPQVLAEKIHSINNAKQLEQIGKQARADMISRYTPEKIQKELITVIEDLLQNTKKTLPDIIPSCKLQTQTEYQSYFEYSLYLIQIVDRTLGQQIFDFSRKVLLNIKVITHDYGEEIYYDCLQQNQFERFYQYLQTEITDTNS